MNEVLATDRYEALMDVVRNRMTNRAFASGDVPAELAIIDVMCFGPPLKPSYKRWKRTLPQIMS